MSQPLRIRNRKKERKKGAEDGRGNKRIKGKIVNSLEMHEKSYWMSLMKTKWCLAHPPKIPGFMASLCPSWTLSYL